MHTLNFKENFKFSRLEFFFWGAGVPLWVCAVKTFQIFDMPTGFGDIRDQSRKLSEIAQNFGRFFRPPKFLGGGSSKKLYTRYDACLTARRMENVLWRYSHLPRSYSGQ